jgi:hypothetical protein
MLKSVNHSSLVVKCRKVAHSRNPPLAWVDFLGVPIQGQTGREEGASLAELCAATELLSPLYSCESKIVHSGALHRQEGIHIVHSAALRPWEEIP